MCATICHRRPRPPRHSVSQLPHQSSRMSCTTTATSTVSSQRRFATRYQPDADSTYKPLTLRLDASTPLSAPYSNHPERMVQVPYQRSPVAQLPVELLSYIFLLGAHTPDEDSELIEDHITPCLSSSSTSPDVFAAVCKHWRSVALGTPQLWTRICVTIGDIIYIQNTFSSVSRAVARSGKCRLDVFIDARDPEWDFSETE